MLCLSLCFIIGVSLSEPHTSGTALHTCVCMFACLPACLLACLLAAIYCKFLMSMAKFNTTKIELMHLVGEGLLSECSVGDPERRRLKLEHA